MDKVAELGCLSGDRQLLSAVVECSLLLSSPGLCGGDHRNIQLFHDGFRRTDDGTLVGSNESTAQLRVGLVDRLSNAPYGLYPIVLELLEDVDILAYQLDVHDIRNPFHVDVPNLLEVFEDLELFFDLKLKLLEPLIRNTNGSARGSNAI